jgi:hypothetical protein
MLGEADAPWRPPAPRDQFEAPPREGSQGARTFGARLLGFERPAPTLHPALQRPARVKYRRDRDAPAGMRTLLTERRSLPSRLPFG